VRILPVLVLAVALAAPCGALAADPDAPAIVVVTDQVVATDVEAVGANLGAIAGGTNLAINNHFPGGGFEPIAWRRLARIDRAGDDWFEWDSFGGPGNWNLSWTGFGNGATVRFYRLVDADGQPLPYADAPGEVDDAVAVVAVGRSTVPMPSAALPEGGWIADDELDRVTIADDDLGLQPGDYAFIDLVTNHLGRETTAPDLQEHWAGDQGGLTRMSGEYTAERVPHPEPVPADMVEPGQSCLRIDAEAGQVRAGHYSFYRYDDGEGQWYSQLHPGASYRVEAWMRQEGLADGGQVAFYFTESYADLSQAEPWVVTEQWQRFTYDFVAPDYPTDNVWHIAQGITFAGPGSLWIDNIVLFRNDEQHGFAPHGPHTVALTELMDSVPAAGPKPVVRFHPMTYQPHPMLESTLGDFSNASYRVAWNASVAPGPHATIAQALRWCLATGDGPETRVVPHLNLPEESSEEEWMGLVEYLGVPYDPAVDTPQSKPWAHKRWLYRGEDGAPWTDEFREILVEFGNETWHNGAGGYGWDGFGPPGWVHQGGKELGLFARYMWGEHVAAMPEWTELGLDQKIRFVLGANYVAEPDSYGELAIQQGAPVSWLGHANYVGPKWETGDEGSSVFDDHGLQETLIGMHTGVRELADQAAATRDALVASGAADYGLMAYEGGPSGYWTNQDDPEIDELYGKSLAMGVAALDAWLYCSSRGYGHQAYLAFTSGTWWSSHTMPEAGGFRPHPGWLALKLRGKHAPGREMVAVELAEVPTLARGEEDVPLLSAYALRDERAWYVFVLSRKLDGQHDGHDFGDGATPVTLQLPFEAPQTVTLHRLARPDGSPADPRDNNREALQITIVTDELDPAAFSTDFVIDEATGGLAGGMPPGTVFLYVFDFGGTGDDDDSATGDDDDSAPGDDDDSTGDGAGGCDCALARSGAGGRGGAAAVALLVLLALRRRRRQG
jgi:MYXO-CTERM domain-containing protein